MQAPHESGLIDFNDSAFRIDLNQYAQQPFTPQMAGPMIAGGQMVGSANHMTGPMAGPMVGPMVGPMAGPMVGPANHMAGPMVGPMTGPMASPMAAPSGHVLSPAQSPMLATHVLSHPAMLAQHYALAAPNGASNQFIAGPPSFVQHTSGQVYKLETDAAPAPAPEPEPEPKSKKPQKSLERLVEERVQSRVEEFIAKTADPEKRATRRRAGGGKSTANAIQELNASMRKTICTR